MAKTNKSIAQWSKRKGNKAGKPIRWERLLMTLANGGLVTLKEIQDTMEYKNMYRIGAEILTLKYHGGVVKAHKNGRNVVGYELVNIQEMVDKYLTPKGWSAKPIVGRDADINTLADLNATPAAKAVTKTKTKAKAVETLEVEEITE